MTDHSVYSFLLQRTAGDPAACYLHWAEEGAEPERILLVDFSLGSYWDPAQPSIPLTAIYLLTADGLHISVTDQAVLPAGEDTAVAMYRAWVESKNLLSYHLGTTLGLSPLSVPKPWGQEIWYSGVEERGVCNFRKAGREVPIPWLQAALPGAELGEPGEPLMLLKILDPSPEPVTGDLYFELHEEKQEVYVVTNVDTAAWPDGVGYIRIGFDSGKLAAYADNEEGFRQAYLSAVQAYEAVRRSIDTLPDTAAPDASLIAREQQLRAEMDGYSHMRPLRLGDVVKVPLLTPHSLQHGVRTIEFQTPVYERKILSFAQEVLTQGHWDTAAAVRQMSLYTPDQATFTPLQDRPGLLVERIVDFSDFEVMRVSLDGDSMLVLPALKTYAMVIVVEGVLGLDEGKYGSEQSAILPRGWEGALAPLEAAHPLVLLLALPKH
ncbi:MAG: hypothetical protein V7746_05255 [Halioglobus sp.]